MNKYIEISDCLNESIIDSLFYAREDKLAQVTDYEKSLVKKSTKTYDNVLKAINNVPDGFIEVRENLFNTIEKLTETLREESGYYSKKYYSSRFS
ncbi:MAG: hypothetical protein FWF46_07245 [Oscillospiraceae bacterium]|nr:hypothetical protein [Oscillospiraceae bacterium]